MARLQQIIAQILVRLRDINMSQRVALLLGGALVAVSLVWLAHWAASPELVPLLPGQDLQAEELTMVRAGLDSLGEKYEIRGSRVFISPNANRTALLAQLQLSEKLPANTSAGFAALVKESDPWISQEENNRRWTYALQNEVERVLRQFQGVKTASVFLNLNAQQRTYARTQPPSSASVTLGMKNGEPVPKALALAAARLVSGAVAGLSPRNVQVLDAGGGAALDWEGEQDPTNTLHRERRKLEQEYTDKIRQQVPDPKALVSVVVELVTTTSNTHTARPIEGGTVSEESTEDTSIRAKRSEAPGVQPNVAIAAGAGGADETRKQTTKKEEFRPGLETKVEATPAGDVRQVSAAISLSSSYLENIFRRTNPDAKAPTEADLNTIFEAERARLANQIQRLGKPQSEENVAIARYYDTSAGPVQAGPTGTLDQTWDLARKYGPQSGLGLLALVALGMMLRLAKKSDTSESFGLELGLPKEAIEAAKAAAEDLADVTTQIAVEKRRPGASARPVSGAALVGGTTSGEVTGLSEVGQAAATEGMLVAQEVDPATVQTRKMLEQVAEMVNSDSDTVSTLLEQWIQKNEQYHDGDA
jgi:flagellar M-ring protein FliF